jgi:AcrR family transcriptional regulator
MSARNRPVARRVGRPANPVDVRGAILAAALRQLEESGGPDRVTIAAIVAEAGCTPPSLYHYWPTRELLLQEASARGWQQFRDTQAAAVRGAEAVTDLGSQDPVERLRSRGRAYLEFALARPALFRVLFLEPSAAPLPAAPDSTAKSRDAEAAGGTGQAFDDLVSDVNNAMAAGRLRPGDPLTTALSLWSAMHGVASLWAVTPGLPADLARDVGNLTQDAVLRGLSPARGTQSGPTP